MSKVSKTVEVSKSADDLGGGLYNILAAAQKALADGWQPGSDVPAIVVAAAGEIMSMVSAAPGVLTDLAEDKMAFVRGITLRCEDMVGLFVK